MRGKKDTPYILVYKSNFTDQLFPAMIGVNLCRRDNFRKDIPKIIESLIYGNLYLKFCLVTDCLSMLNTGN